MKVARIPRRAARKLIDRFKYGVPLLPARFDPAAISDALRMIGSITSAAIIGRGASLRVANPIDLIKDCDFKLIMNRVEVENLTEFLGETIDAQIAQPPGGLITVLDAGLIRRFGLKFLISNKHRDSDGFRRFYSTYRNRGVPICCIPDDSAVKYDFCRKSYPHRTQCGSILKVLYNIDSLERIVFAGVDFFRFGYLHEGDDVRLFPRMLDNAAREKGDPLLKFIFETVPMRNEHNPLTVYFPALLKPLIDFPDLPCFKFYGPESTDA